jgi:hypothetical protein
MRDGKGGKGTRKINAEKQKDAGRRITSGLERVVLYGKAWLSPRPAIYRCLPKPALEVERMLNCLPDFSMYRHLPVV